MTDMAKKTLTLSLALVALLCVPLAFGALAGPDDPPPAAGKGKDDALDDLLKKVEQDEARTADKPAAGKPDAQADSPGGSKPSGEVATKDKDLDSLLEKLGATEDKAAPDDR